MKIISETETTALVDGGNGCGQVVSYKSMNIAIEKAKKILDCAVDIVIIMGCWLLCNDGS